MRDASLRALSCFSPAFGVSADDELAIRLSFGQMEVLKQVGGYLGREGTRRKYAACGRPYEWPKVGLLPPVAATRVGAKRPPSAAASR